MYIFLKKISFFIQCIISLGLIVACFALHTSPLMSVWIAFLGLGFVYLWGLNFLVFAYQFYRRSKHTYISLIGLIISLLYLPNIFQFQIFSPSAPSPTAIKVLTYNVHYCNYLSQRKQKTVKETMEGVLNYLIGSKADVLCLQEFSGETSQQSFYLHNALQKHYPFHYTGGGTSLAIYSRYPLSDFGLIPFEKSYNSAIYANVRLPKSQIRVYNMHLQSIRLGGDAEQVFDIQDKDKNKYRRIGSKLLNAFGIRARQVEKLTAHIRESNLPVLICGDMNDTPISYAYRCLSGLAEDSFKACGNGWDATYAGKIPFLRIDYVWASPGAVFHSHEVSPQPYSDHYPVSVQVSL